MATNTLGKTDNAKLTKRQHFTKFLKYLLTQQLIKLSNFLRESFSMGDTPAAYIGYCSL